MKLRGSTNNKRDTLFSANYESRKACLSFVSYRANRWKRLFRVFFPRGINVITYVCMRYNECNGRWTRRRERRIYINNNLRPYRGALLRVYKEARAKSRLKSISYRSFAITSTSPPKTPHSLETIDVSKDRNFSVRLVTIKV